MDAATLLYRGLGMVNFAQYAQGHIGTDGLENIMPGTANDANASINIAAEFAAPAEPNFPMRFRNFAEFHASETARYELKPVTDPTYPVTDEQDYMWAKAVMHNLLNMDGIVDGQKMIKQWTNIMRDRMDRIEAVSWSFVRQTKRYHRILGPLDPTNPDNARSPKIMSFAEHMNMVLPHIRVTKTLCRHITSYFFLNTFIDGPDQTMFRIGANRRVNNSKKAKSQRAAAAAQKVVDLGLKLGEEEVAELFEKGKKRERPAPRLIGPRKRPTGRRISTSSDESDFSLEDDSDDEALGGGNPKARRGKRSAPAPLAMSNQTRYSLRRRGGDDEGAGPEASTKHEKDDTPEHGTEPNVDVPETFSATESAQEPSQDSIGAMNSIDPGLNNYYADDAANAFWYMDMTDFTQTPPTNFAGVQDANPFTPHTDFSYFNSDASDLFSHAPSSSTTNRSFFPETYRTTTENTGSYSPSPAGRELNASSRELNASDRELNASVNPFAGTRTATNTYHGISKDYFY